MIKCKTCCDIAEWQNIIETNRRSEWSDKLMCCLKVVGWYKDENKKTLANSRSQITTKPYLLKYCPTCGNKLDKRHLKKLLKEVGQ